MNKKRRKRKRLKIKSLLIFLLAIIIIICFIYGLTLLKVRSFYVYNNHFLTDEQVLKELKLDKKTSFLLTNTAIEKAIINKNKYIKDVKIKKTLDLEIKVYVSEYRMLFYDKKENKTVIENGEKIDHLDNDLPTLLNDIDDKEIYNSLIKKFKKVNNNSLQMISEITYSPNGIDKERFLLSMNDGNYVYVTLTKLSKINEYKSIIDSVENKKGILYLDYGNYFVPKE